MTNFEYYIAGGMKYEGWRKFYDKDQFTVKGTSTIDKYNNWLLKEHEEPILDDIEKKYLSSIIKPFRNRVLYISKIDAGNKNSYFIEMRINNNGMDYVVLPNFSYSAKMYTNMKPDHHYTLKELNL
jgi:hypothetical protein